MSSWFFDQTNYRSQEAVTRMLMIKALNHARPRVPVTLYEWNLLSGYSSREMSAVNMKGRVKWMEALCDEFGEHFGLGPDMKNPKVPMFFTTLVDVVKCSTPHDFNPEDAQPFIRPYRTGLQGMSYLAILEPAYFVNKAAGSYVDNKRLVCWHCHAVCWGITKDALARRVGELNGSGKFTPVAMGPSGAHAVQIPKTSRKGLLPLADKFRYMGKSPRKGYRLGKGERITEDGEIVNYFRINQQELRDGERVTVFRLLKHLYMDQLTFAGGEGVPILAKARKQAFKGIRYGA